MPFYKYDYYSSPPNVYEIVKDFYGSDILNSINDIETGMDFYGLSEVVSAQWDKECVSLTLYNRDVVYNQDFFAKNKLVIAPQLKDCDFYKLGEDPFAEPKIFTDSGSKDRFIIEAKTKVQMVAGESIEFKPGFEVKRGSTFSASISPNDCSKGL